MPEITSDVAPRTESTSYYQAHRAEILERKKLYYQENKERLNKRRVERMKEDRKLFRELKKQLAQSATT